VVLPLKFKILGALAIVGAVIYWVVTSIEEYGQSKYQAGYDARNSEYSQALAKAEKKITKAERAEREISKKLQEALQENSSLSSELADQIRDASFNCDHIGPGFVELFNAGSEPKLRNSD
jgi:predicted RNase H-like nuclease (RuvC/YqgF family)